MSVYFIRRDDATGPIKIGCSGCPSGRARNLSWSMRQSLVVLASAPGGYTEERRLHARFADHRERGEWFSATPELLALIKAVRASGTLEFAPEEDREAMIVRRYLAGETLQKVGAAYGLTRERVRQILEERKIPRRHGWRAFHGRIAA